MHTAIIWTLKELHLFCNFYEREGGCLLKRTGKWGPPKVALPEVAFGLNELKNRSFVDE